MSRETIRGIRFSFAMVTLVFITIELVRAWVEYPRWLPIMIVAVIIWYFIGKKIPMTPEACKALCPDTDDEE